MKLNIILEELKFERFNLKGEDIHELSDGEALDLHMFNFNKNNFESQRIITKGLYFNI